MGSRAKLNLVLLLVAALSLAISAAASVEDTGEQLFQEGVRLANDRDYQGALEHFERAMAYTPRLNVLWNIACCHVVLGHRDLAVACLDRYMEHDLAFQESAEMQAAVADVEGEPADMPDARRRGELWDGIAAASQAVEKGEATEAPDELRLYGVGSRSVRYKTGDNGTSPEGRRGRELNEQVIELYRSGSPEEALPFAERVAAYIANTSTYHNIAVIHLSLGHRDLALDFLDLFQQRVPQLRESAEFRLLVRDIGAAPPQIDAATARGFVDRVDPAYDSATSPEPRPPVRTEMGEQD
ncbi:MAG TPA: hypothetical protein PKJ99_10735 [Thermoanaerobaculales bacterium]|nr:hypothetical protein [Thermoanaerobaculales bacterium]